MHLKRWLTSLVLLPLLVLLLLFGGAHLFSLFIALICFLSLREYYRIFWHHDKGSLVKSVSTVGYILGPALVLCSHFLPLPLFLALFSFSLILTGWICLGQFQTNAGIPSVLSVQALAMTYIPLALASLVLIRHSGSGAQWILLIVCVVFAGDVSAYYVGTFWGSRKLCPAVSPGKTVEGALGGLVGNLAVGFALGNLLLPSIPVGKGLVLFIAMGVVGQVGDLFESMLKRSAGVKDSGDMLPGHGGLLDRIDALLFAAPVALAMVRYFY